MEKLYGIKKLLCIVGALVMVSVVFTACTFTGNTAAVETSNAEEGPEGTKKPANPESSAAGSGTESESAVSPENGGGSPRERIVSGYYITTSACIALGLQDNLVGIEAKASGRPIYGLSAPELLDLPSVGTAKEFDLEGCIALNPDLVILPKKLSEQADILKNMGMEVLVVNPESLEELKETINMIAAETGTEERAGNLMEWYREKEEKLAGIVDDAQPSVYFAGTSSILRTASPRMYQNSLIQLAGGINAASDLVDNGWSNISYEQLLAYNPDVIVVIPEAEYTKEDVMNDSRLAGVGAVRSGRVFEMPSSFEAWDSPVPSGMLGSMWLSSVLHEEVYPFEEFKEEAAEFYREFYGVEIDRELITR